MSELSRRIYTPEDASRLGLGIGHVQHPRHSEFYDDAMVRRPVAPETVRTLAATSLEEATFGDQEQEVASTEGAA